MFTPYRELDALLADLVREVRDILGDTFVGAYVQGSFALGAGDLHSDCDFIVATTVPPRGPAEAGLRRLHDEIPTRPGHWTGHLEGSYADITSLRDATGLGTPWLFCDHGHRVLIRDTHCNTLHTRWILRNRGITLAGPPITGLVDEVDPDALRAGMRAMLPGLMDELRTWASFELGWTQRYAVTTYCRMLFTLHTGEVTSKRGALEWARAMLDPRWRPLLTQVAEDRVRGWDPLDPPRPGGMEALYEFAAYAESLARGG
ncbi:aminoglycoside adenylyltransferase domain-containing protein [Streptomyces lincolnensis]|uniref:aminoglycoside adenylyltransferase domain-containing protein n=1 Tax=Streptomyces lincolnensis TaxID=1915 RepID=UPI0037D1F415